MFWKLFKAIVLLATLLLILYIHLGTMEHFGALRRKFWLQGDLMTVALIILITYILGKVLELLWKWEVRAQFR